MQDPTELKIQRHLAVACLSIVLCFLLYQLASFFAETLRILGISLLLAYLFINVVDFLEGYIRSRAASILIVYAALLIATTIGAIFFVPATMYQVSQLVGNVFNAIPEFVQYLIQAITPLEQRLHAAQIDVKAIDILTTLAGNLPKPEPTLVLGQVTMMAMSTMTWLIYGISIAVLSFYFLLDGRRLKDRVINLFPHRYQQRLQLMAADIDNNLQSFFRGQVVLGIAIGVVMLAVYVSLGVEYALLLSILLAIWEIVPVIGPPLGFLPAIISVAIHGMSNCPGNRLIQILIITLIFNIIQQLKDNVVAPKYIGNVIGLHPIIIFIAIMIGARLDGIAGIIFALPVACVINVFLSHAPWKAEAEAAANLTEPELNQADSFKNT